MDSYTLYRMVKARGYHSPLREAQAVATRTRILGAARAVFGREGYAATSIDRIAVEAGVSPRTIFGAFGSKSGILWALREAALYRDEQPGEGGVLPGLGTILEERDPRAQLRQYAALARVLHDRSWDVLEIERDAAGADPEVAARRREAWRRQYETTMRLARSIARPGPLRRGLTTKEAGELILTLGGHDAYKRLVVDCGWTSDRYEHWLGEALVRELLAAG